MRELSVVITVMNEEDNIYPLVKAIQDALQTIDYEIVFVDDGSTDATRKKIKDVIDERIVLVELRKNYGQSTAMAAGIDYASGKYIALMDGDLQNDPTDIPMMLNKLITEDWDVVAGNRANRKDGAFLRKIPSKIANAIIRSMTKVYFKDYGCTLKVFRHEIAEDLGLYGELHRFIPVLAAMQGARITQVDVKHHARQFGQSKYGLGRTFRVMSDLVTMVFFRKYSQKRFTAYSYYFLTRAMDSHNLGRGRTSVQAALQSIAAKTLVIGIASDILFPPQEQELLAAYIPNAKLEIINSYYGHDGFLLECETLTRLLESFISKEKIES